MLYNKRLVSLILSFLLIFSLLSYMSFPIQAAIVYPNKYTYIRHSPYWFSSVVDEFSTTQGVTLLERDGNYIYISYRKNNVLKRGYMPLADITNPNVSWCNYAQFNPGKINSTTSITLYYGPGTEYGTITTLSNNIGTTTNNPLLILGYYGSYAQIQYVTNPTQTSNAQPQYCRGWILSSKITVTLPTASGYLETGVYALIRNLSNNKYLTVTNDASATSGYKVTFAAPTGEDNQHWKITKYTHSSGGIYYKIISKSTGLCLQVKDGYPINGTGIDLVAPADPSKAQEFEMSEQSDFVYNNVTVGKKYVIKTRLTGSYQSLDIKNNTLVEQITSGSQSQLWAIERFNKFWDNSYTNLPKNGNTFNLKYYIDVTGGSGDVYHVANIDPADIVSTIEKWNIQDANGNRYITSTRTFNENEAKVKIYAANINVNLVARCNPVVLINGVEVSGSQYVNYDWIYADIQLNISTTSTAPYNKMNNYDAKKGVISHEFGHALKLTHPYGERDEVNNSYIDHVVYSTMNQGVYTATSTEPRSKLSYEPTRYDKQNLLNKWSDV